MFDRFTCWITTDKFQKALQMKGCSTTLVFSASFFKQEDIFVIRTIIHFVVTAIVKNKCWLYLFSKYAKQNFCFIENASSASSNGHHKGTAKIGNGFNLHLNVWQGSEFASDHNTVTLFNKNSFQNLFFKNLRKVYKRFTFIKIYIMANSFKNLGHAK